MDVPIRMLYRHKTGKIFYLIGVAEDKDKFEHCIISSIDNGKVFIRPIDMFRGEEASFVLVRPEA